MMPQFGLPLQGAMELETARTAGVALGYDGTSLSG